MRFLFVAVFLWALSPVASAGEVTAAVASNFAAAMKALVKAYSAQSETEVRVSYGATGKLYAQIRNGAPFDLFLAADRARPARLEQDGAAVEASRFTYARGRLVLWSAVQPVADGEAVLRRGDFKHLAVANPRTAPYGVAAEQVLRNLGLYEALQPRLVYGENIAQTHQFVAGGAAELGFVALAQLVAKVDTPDTRWWPVPDTLYEPVEQQAVLLNDRPPARGFYEFLKSAPARAVIERYGYRLPDEARTPDE
jgi:molybdate transport system substrate-binding protein